MTAAVQERSLSASQQLAVDRVSEWLDAAPKPRYCDDGGCLSSAEDRPHTHGEAYGYPVLSLGGLAGTGKTHVLGALPGLLSVRASLGTPTNKSAAVLRSKLPEDQKPRCSTYHSLLFLPDSWYTCLDSGEVANELQCSCGRGFEHDSCSCPQFQCRQHQPGCRVEGHLKFTPRAFAGGYRDLVILDEASMVTEDQVNEIRGFGLPVLLVGDHGQLPPVKGALSPWMLSPDLVLEENFRQAEESGIVAAALEARATGRAPAGKHGNGVLVGNGKANPELFNALLPHRLPPGPDSGIITWTNRSRADVNGRIHAAMALERGFEPSTVLIPGDRVVSLGNFEAAVVKPQDGGIVAGKYKLGGAVVQLFNGQLGTVLEVLNERSKVVDAVIELDSPDSSTPPEMRQKVLRRLDRQQFGLDRPLRPDERARGAAAFDYAYALTCHKAQGSEFEKVAVLGQGPSGPDRSRWLYTAMTRAKDKLLVIT